jgi:hypothetical protein
MVYITNWQWRTLAPTVNVVYPSPFFGGGWYDIEILEWYKPSRIDQNPAELIKAGYKINRLLNYVWNKDELPRQWKESIIVPN